MLHSVFVIIFVSNFIICHGVSSDVYVGVGKDRSGLWQKKKALKKEHLSKEKKAHFLQKKPNHFAKKSTFGAEKST